MQRGAKIAELLDALTEFLTTESGGRPNLHIFAEREDEIEFITKECGCASCRLNLIRRLTLTLYHSGELGKAETEDLPSTAVH